MKTAIYPGSFNPWHEGHQDILEKALQVFDRVILARAQNPDPKKSEIRQSWSECEIPERLVQKIIFVEIQGFLHKYVEVSTAYEISAVIRGLRNGYDLQHEMNQQYWYEDLGLKIPVVYFITDRKLGHISSSAIRDIRRFKNISDRPAALPPSSK